MRLADLKTIAVIGAGDMGHGIAEVALLAGYKVFIQDIKREFLDRGVGRIQESLQKMIVKGKINQGQYKRMVEEFLKPVLGIDAAASSAELVIEAVPEIFNLKRELIRKLDQVTRKETILASNSSNMSITELGRQTTKPENVVGMHFFNPPVIMKLVEVIRGQKTCDPTMQVIHDLCLKMGKFPVRVEKDTPGFIVNRVQAPRGVLLGAILDYGIAEPEAVDAMMVTSAGLPMGPYELLDFVGIDIAYHSAKYRAEVLHPDFAPSNVLEEKMKAGQLGKKTGKGFYDWSEGRPKIDLKKATNKVSPMDFLAVVLNEATKLIQEGVTTAKDIDLAIENGTGNRVGPFKSAKDIDHRELAARLEVLSRQFHKEIFRPTEMLKMGTYKGQI